MSRDTFTCEIYNKDHSYTFSQINDVLYDSEGYVWLAMRDYGINKINGDYSKKYMSTESGIQFITGGGLYEDDDNNLFFCTNIGPMLYDRARDLVKPLAESEFMSYHPYESSAFCMRQTKENEYLIGTKSGIHVYNMELDSVIHKSITGEYKVDGASSDKHVYKMANDTLRNCIWATTRSGLLKINKEDYSVTKISYNDPISEKWPWNYMNDIFLYKDELFIKYLNTKIIKYDINKNQWELYRHEVLDNFFTEEKNDSIQIHYEVIKSYKDRYLILPNRQTGIDIIDLEKDKEYKPYIKNKLFSGIGKFENSEWLAHRYLREVWFALIDKNGYIIASHVRNHVVKTKENVFHTDKKDQFGSIKVSELYINNKKENRFNYVTGLNRFKFEKFQRNIALDYSLINPPTEPNIKYEYKLNNNQWQQNLHKNNLSVTNLKGGKHELSLRASADKKLIDKQVYTIEIEPFWHEKWIYRILLAFSILIPILCFNAYRIRKRKEKESLKFSFNKKIAEIEMTALRAQMNPHFLFNSLNSINKYIVTSNPQVASEYLTKFSRLMRQILLNSKSKLISLEEELLALKLYMEIEELRFDHKFSFSINVDSNVNANSTLLPPLLLQPYVENAIWHGLLPKKSNGQLVITIENKDQQLHIEIDDNGIGRTQALINNRNKKIKKKSMGMEITRDRLELIKEIYSMETKIEIIDKYKNEVAQGTKVLITIPLLS